MINASNERIYVGLLTYKLLVSTKNLSRLTIAVKYYF